MIKNENVEGEPAYDETYRRGPVVMRGPMIPKDNTCAKTINELCLNAQHAPGVGVQPVGRVR